MFQQGGASQAQQQDAYVDTVAIKFVETYYTRLAEQPESVAVFYHPDDSAFSRLEPDQASMVENNVIGQSGIREAISAQGYEGCKVFFRYVDCQSSVDGCIIVMITGIMMVKSQVRNFAQTFVLGRQGPAESPSYYLRNDILRFLDTVVVDPASQAAGGETATSGVEPQPAAEASAQPAAQPEPVAPTPVMEAAPEEATPVVEEAAAPAEEAAEQQTEQQDEALAASAKVSEPVVQQQEQPAEEKQTRGKRERRQRREKKESKGPAKKAEAPAAAAKSEPVSWASRLGSKHIMTAAVDPAIVSATPAAQDAPEESAAAVETAAPAPKAEAAAAPADRKQAGKPLRGPKQAKGKFAGKPDSAQQDDSCSLYVKNVSANVKQGLLDLFTQFGACTVEFPPHKNYAFIHYETVAHATAALEGRPLELEGQQLVIDRKKPPRSNPKFADRGDGFYERGNGGYRGDSRGRGRFRPRRGRGRGGGMQQGGDKGGSK